MEKEHLLAHKSVERCPLPSSLSFERERTGIQEKEKERCLALFLYPSSKRGGGGEGTGGRRDLYPYPVGERPGCGVYGGREKDQKDGRGDELPAGSFRLSRSGRGWAAGPT